MQNKFFLACFFFTLTTLALSAQRITYSQLEKNDMHSVDFKIIGKIDNHYLVYKQANTSHSILLYDNEMKLINKVNMDFVPDKIVNAEIILYRDYFYFVYQYQKNNVVTCAVAKMNKDGKIIDEPVILDTTSINFSMSSNIYNVLYSEDKQKIMIYRISNKEDTTYITCSLFNEQLKLLDKFSLLVRLQAQNDFLTEMVLDNSGTIAFSKLSGNSDLSKAQNISLMVKNPYDNNINIYPLDIGKRYLRDIRIQPDNLNNHFLITGFYFNQKQENIDGLYCAVWNNNNRQITVSKQIAFNNQLKNNARTQASSTAAFNDYHLQNILMQKDGGFVVISESAYQSNHGTYDSWTNNFYNSTEWYNQTNSPSFSADVSIGKDYFANNITLMSFDSIGNMEWSAVIPKSQYGKGTYNFISYGTCLKPGELNFLFNQSAGGAASMRSLKINAIGETTLNPILNKLNRNYAFMPRFAKQVSSNEVLIPCEHKNDLCFAKIEF